MTTYPYGYAGSMMSRSQLESMTTVKKLHPEFWRRAMALFEAAAAAGVPLGVGCGWRIQPANKPGFASPGNSNHEGFPADGVSGWAVAIDTVPTSSWNWMEGQLAKYGLRSFRNVNNEPWHIQPSDIPASRSYRKERWNLPVFNLPGAPTRKFPEKIPKPVLKKGDKGLGVRRLINILMFFKWYPQDHASDKNDGTFGSRTVIGVKNMQKALKVPITGNYDVRTTKALRVFYANIAKL